MAKYRINYKTSPHGAISWKHEGNDDQYCEAGELVTIDWQPSAGWGLQEAHYTDALGNATDIDITTKTFTMPSKDITIEGTFKKFELDDWTGDEDQGKAVDAITVTDITALTEKQIKGLRSGDVVVLRTGNTRKSYRVSVKGTGDLQLTYSDYNGVDTVKYVSGVYSTTEHLDTTTPLSVEIEYDDLVDLRDNGNLVPGTWYRITDYTCTTTQENTQSAGHLFDIVVLALDGSHLAEEAFAAHHAGDTYFSNCKLDAWELKYCLDNDTNRFAWADDENGTGVIFYMKDEWNNECPYDFKNIMFKRWAVTEVTDSVLNQDTVDALNEIFVFDGSDNSKFQARFGYQENNCTYGSTVHVVDAEDSGWYYTFSIIMNDVDSGEFAIDNIEDGSIKGNNFYNDEGGGGFHGNSMKPRYNNMASDEGGIDGAQVLNNIVFNGYYENSEEAPHIYACFMNHLGGNCYDNTFGNNCSSNTFGNNCFQNSFGNYFQNNSFGNNFQNNSFGNNCYYNSFGNNCNWNSFGNNCFQNSFGNYFQNNSFGNGCNSNSFGNDCYYNSFGNNCSRNSFGNYCQNNSFGNSCGGNSFGNDCGSNSFGNYCRHITVFDGVGYCSVTGGSSEQSYVQNAQILNGTAGASQDNKLTITFAANKAYTQIAGKTTNGNLEIWNPAD